MSSGRATFRDLDEYHGAEDLYDLLEIVTVDNYNKRLANQKPGG